MGVITHIAAREVLFECAMTDDKLVIVCCNEPFSVNIKTRKVRVEEETGVRGKLMYGLLQLLPASSDQAGPASGISPRCLFSHDKRSLPDSACLVKVE